METLGRISHLFRGAVLGCGAGWGRDDGASFDVSRSMGVVALLDGEGAFENESEGSVVTERDER